MEAKISSKPVVQKLGLKHGQKAVFLNIPSAVAPLLKISKDHNISDRISKDCEFLLGFYPTTKSLKSDLTKISKNLVKSGMAWVCWKKGNVTDLSRDSIAALAKAAGLETVSSCSISDDWSALKLMFPKNQRK